MNFGALFLCASSLLPQGQGPTFTKSESTETGVARATVTGDRRAVSCLGALEDLALAMGWSLSVESKPLENDLRAATVDIALAGQEPRITAQLIAVAAGADVVFEEGSGDGSQPTVHVTRTPTADTDAGRQRLRGIAKEWYRSYLQDELRFSPAPAGESMQARMHLGHLLAEQGDLEAALPFFSEIYDKRPGEHVAPALLRLAKANCEIGAQTLDQAKARERFEQAEKWCRKLLDLHPASPEATGATVTLGRALLGQARVATDDKRMRELCDRCRTELAARVMRLQDTVEMLEVWLVVGEAQLRLEWPGRVLETMLTLRDSSNFADLDDRQFVDYHFLLGYGALGTGSIELAMKSLEWFLIHATSDRRRGAAHVMLADAYLRLGRYVEARASALAAKEQHMADLDARERTEALRLYARTGLALGEKESAFEELEVLVHREDDPELTLFLVDELIADRQWQRAISVARILCSRDNDYGDKARFKSVEALFEQARASKTLPEFPALAREIAPRIKEKDLRARCAEMIGDAYTQMGQLESAADAYRGILR